MSAPSTHLPEEFFPLVLVGLPGAGKTTVARELSRLVGGAGCDLDSEIKRRTRMSIPEIFRTRGEAAFRDIETDTLEHALAVTRGVIALGGGALERARNRELLRGRIVIYLQVTPQVAAARIGDDGDGRPLLERDDASVDQVLLELFAARERYYTDVATLRVRTDDLTPAEVAQRCVEALVELADLPASRRVAGCGRGMATRIRVGEDRRAYWVGVGRGLCGEVVGALRPETRTVALVHPDTLSRQAADLAAALREARLDVVDVPHADGEAAKDIAEVTACWEALGRHRLTRQDAVIALGGGATTDMAGFVAATWMRGIDLVQVPTTLLAMVDAAVGGKTGINTSSGKNLVGAFYPPRAVIVDLDYLDTLPEADLRAGLAEVAKCGFIADRAITRLIDADPAGCLTPTSATLAELVERAIRVKAGVVTVDLTEAGPREYLNYGHTFGHAIEWAEDYGVRHGEAVAAGMMFAAHLGRLTGRGPADLVEVTARQLGALGLPTGYAGQPIETLIDRMYSDKKVRAGQLRFVLLEDWGAPAVYAIDDRDLVSEAARLTRETA